MQLGVIALQAFDEALGDAVAFRTAQGREQKLKVERAGPIGGVLGDIGAAIVWRRFGRMLCLRFEVDRCLR